MLNSLILMQKLPVADWIESLTEWMTQAFAGFFSFLQNSGQGLMDGITQLLLLVPPIVMIVGLTLIAFFISKKKLSLPIFTGLGLLFILNQNLWNDLISTFTLVLISSLVSIILGVPLGILMAKNDKAQSIITPILDFMQTMPGFVYLIPAVAFFGIGMVPGVFASVIFALPPTVRFTNLGIRQVPKELVEASDSFGGTGWQKLFKLELPLAKNTMLAGINQTTMLALSMVVTASMIGAPGLGRGVLSALQRAQVGNGFVNGVALVILAIIIDRFIQYINKPKKTATKKKGLTTEQKKKRGLLITLAVVLVAIFGVTSLLNKEKDKEEINLAYVEWDTEVASTNVIGEVLREAGYKVTLTPLDNSIMWQSIANGETDAMVAGWLPNTHEAYLKKYQDKVDPLGVNLKGAKIGLVVPTYMDVDSIEDLDQEAQQKITGIEPGAGTVNLANETVKTYPNLKDWTVETSSSGAMTVALGQAIKKQEPIVITGWSPHWMFAKYDLKYLKDPKETMGTEENIETFARKGLKEDNPEAYKILKNFEWEQKDIESVMLDVSNGEDAQAAAKKWIDANRKTVDSWKSK